MDVDSPTAAVPSTSPSTGSQPHTAPWRLPRWGTSRPLRRWRGVSGGGVTPSHRLGRPLLLSRDAYHPKSSSLWHLGWSEAHVSFGGKKASLHLSVQRAVAAAVTSSPRESRAALFPSLWARVRVASAWGGSGLCSKGERGSGKSHPGS